MKSLPTANASCCFYLAISYEISETAVQGPSLDQTLSASFQLQKRVCKQ